MHGRQQGKIYAACVTSNGPFCALVEDDVHWELVARASVHNEQKNVYVEYFSYVD